MEFKKTDDGYVVSIAPGEKIMETLKDFCISENITLGSISGIGAVDFVELAHYTVPNKEYKSKIFEEPFEMVNITGNVSTMDGEVYLHCHAVFGNSEMNVVGGHLVEGRVSAACELIVVPMKGSVNRKHSEEIGLNLFKF